jgi:hypothetical protein
MKIQSIKELVQAVRATYGADRIVPYADSDEDPYGTGFRVTGIRATFSVLTQEGRFPDGMYDVQIESYPPGDYLFTKVVSRVEFLRLMDLVTGPEDRWPKQD